MTSDSTIYTIGHSVHSVETFLALLAKTGISAIADVRSVPFSRRQPQFTQHALRERLASGRLSYVFLGSELGGRGADDSMYDKQGRVQYRRIAESAGFREGLRRVRSGSARMRVALMCAESEPLECHRGILISRLLVAQGASVVHIHADGHLETHIDAECRLLRVMGLHEPDLFRTHEEMLADAYERQEARIAYVKPSVYSDNETMR